MLGQGLTCFEYNETLYRIGRTLLTTVLGCVCRIFLDFGNSQL